MGAWGPGTLDNDSAVSWLRIDVRLSGIAALDQAFDFAMESIDDGYIESPTAGAALGGAELVAAAHGRPLASVADASAGMPVSEVTEMAEQLGDALRARADFLEEAIVICDGVTAGVERSEIMDGWESPALMGEFVANVGNLKTRLEAAA